MRVIDAIKANLFELIIVFLAFFIMVVIGCAYTSSIVNEQMKELSEREIDTIETAFEGNLSKAELAFVNMVEIVEGEIAAGASNERILIQFKDINEYHWYRNSGFPDYLKVYGYIREEFLDASGWIPPGDYVPQERPWYIGAQENENQVFFSEPYIDADTRDTCITFSKVIKDRNGVSIGVLGLDLDMSTISNYIINRKMSNDGYGVLVSSTLNLSAHRDKKVIGLNMNDISEEYARIAGILSSDTNSVSALRFTDFNGTDSVSFFRTILNGWHIGIIMPRAYYYRNVYRLMIYLSTVALVLVAILSYILIKIRISQLSSDAESRSKTEFLSRMSHEMRTPMNVIIGMSNIARETDNEERRAYAMNQITKSSKHLLSIINDVLDISKIEAGKSELLKETFVFTEMIESVNGLIGLKVAEKGIQYHCTISDQVPVCIYSDRQKLTQVLVNLLSNAIKFTSVNGHVQLNISCEKYKEDRLKLYFEVIDDGIGISPDQQTKLFKTFEQADGGITRKYGGTGLGLAISKSYIEMMEGKIQLKSVVNEGSKFFFHIIVGQENMDCPKNKSCYSTIGNDSNKEKDHGNDKQFPGKRLLLVEDYDINREVFVLQLENTKLFVECAENGLEACRMFEESNGNYDIIFMDIHMPEMDGYEATRLIRSMSLQNAKTVPIIAMTASVFKEDVEKSFASGMDEHIGKPIDRNKILEVLTKYLG